MNTIKKIFIFVFVTLFFASCSLKNEDIEFIEEQMEVQATGGEVDDTVEVDRD